MEFLNAIVSLANYMLVPALAYGSQLALGALGITLIYSILRFAHFAHGDTMALGTAAVIGGTFFLQGQGVGIAPLPTALLALPFGVLVMVAYLLAADRLVYRYYRRVRAKPMIFVMASLGVMFVTNGITRLFMGVGETRFEDGARFVFNVRDFRAATGLAEGLALRNAQAITIVTALIVMVALFWFLTRTRAGKSMRAYSDNEDLALLSGINPERVVTITWVITGILLVLAGTLYGLDKGFRAFNYFQLLLPMFAAAILGGLGSPIGRDCRGLCGGAGGNGRDLRVAARGGLPAARGAGAVRHGAAAASGLQIRRDLHDPCHRAAVPAHRHLQGESAMTARGYILFALMGLVLLAVGALQSWQLAITILNMSLISAIMALGVNMQWGYAGLFNVGVMGFTAIGGLAVVLVAQPPVPEAWGAGGPGALLGLLLGVAPSWPPWRCISACPRGGCARWR